MAVYSYTLATGETRWMYIIALPAGADGRRRQLKRKAFPSQAAALAAEADSRAAYGGADLTADGTLAAELEGWLTEREIDIQPTTVVNYRDLVRCYILDDVRRSHCDKPATHFGPLVSRRVLDDQTTARREHLAIDIEHHPTVVVGDLRVLTQPEEAFLDEAWVQGVVATP
jgi:hypothetical protein